MNTIKLYLSGLVMVFALVLRADITYYVDAKNGSDDYDGLSEATAKQSLAAICDMVNKQSPVQALTTVIVLPGNYGEDEGTDKKVTFEGIKTDKNPTPGVHDYRVVLTVTSANRKVLFKSKDGKEVTHIVGKPDPNSAAGNDGCGPAAIGGVRGNSAAYMAFVDFTFRDCYAADAKDDNVDRGGAAYAITMVDCVVSNCVATRGGAINTCTAHRCRFTNNKATTATNGSAANGSALSNCLVDNNIFASPLSYPTTVINCTIVNNKNNNSGGNRVFCQLSNVNNAVYNCLVIGNSNDGINNVKAGTAIKFQSLVAQGTRSAYTFDGVTTIGEDCKFGVNAEQFVDAANLDFRVVNTSDAVNAGRSEYASLLAIPSWVGDTTVRDYAGNAIDLTKETIQAGCLQEVVKLPAIVTIDASAEDVEVEGGVIGDNKLMGEIIVRAKRTDRPFVGFRVNGELLPYTTELNLNSLGLETGDVVTLTADYGTIWYVKQNGGNDDNLGGTPETAKKTIKAAATYAVSGDEIKVYPGVYGDDDGVMYHTTKRVNATTSIYVPTRVVLADGVSMTAIEGAEVTSIVGKCDEDIEDKYPLFGCGPKAVRCVMLGKGSTITGFTITGGRTDYTEESYDDNSISGGVYGRYGTLATIDNGTASYVVDCVLTNNAAPQAAFAIDSYLVRCKIVDNKGVNRHASRGCAFTGCFINSNYGGAMEHVRLVDSCTIGSKSRAIADTKDFNVMQYPTRGMRIVNSICLASIAAMPNTESYMYAVTNCVFLSSAEKNLVKDGISEYDAVTFIAKATDAKLDDDYRPVPGQTIAEIVDGISADDEGLSMSEYIGDKDVEGKARVMNGRRDLGAIEGDWRPKYSSDIQGRAVVVEASATIKEIDGKVVVPAGAKIVLWVNNTASGAKDYILKTTVAGGTLSVKLDDAAVEVADSAAIAMSVPAGEHLIEVSLSGTETDKVTIDAIRGQGGILVIVK